MVFHFPPSAASVMNMSIISQFIPARVLAIIARSQIQARQSKLSPSPSLLPKYKNHPLLSTHTFFTSVLFFSKSVGSKTQKHDITSNHVVCFLSSAIERFHQQPNKPSP